MGFGKKLQWQRKKKGWSQEALAAELHVSRQAISKGEHDASLPDAAIVVQLARLFGVSTDYFLLKKFCSFVVRIVNISSTFYYNIIQKISS